MIVTVHTNIMLDMVNCLNFNIHDVLVLVVHRQ